MGFVEIIRFGSVLESFDLDRFLRADFELDDAFGAGLRPTYPHKSSCDALLSTNGAKDTDFCLALRPTGPFNLNVHESPEYEPDYNIIITIFK